MGHWLKNSDAFASHHLLGGYALFQQQYPEELIDSGRAMLLQIGSDDHTGMCWGDGGELTFYADAKALAKGRFERLWGECQDSQATMTLGVSWDGNKILGLANDRVLKEWNLATGRAPQQLAKLAKAPNFAIAAEPRTNTAVVFASDARTGVLELWDLASSQVTKTLQTTGLNGFITPLAISADGTLSVTTQMLLDEDSGGRSRAELALWNHKSGKSLRRYRGHSGRVVAACLSADANMLISISEDRTVRIYSTERDEQIDQIDLGEVSDTPSSVALSKDAKDILVGTTRGVALRFKLR